VAKWCQGWLQGPFTLVEWIDFEIDLKRKLDEFEGSFEWDEWKEDYFFFDYFLFWILDFGRWSLQVFLLAHENIKKLQFFNISCKSKIDF
jgi:hypothetical protein